MEFQTRNKLKDRIIYNHTCTHDTHVIMIMIIIMMTIIKKTMRNFIS